MKNTNTEDWTVVFDDQLSFSRIECWSDLNSLCSRFPYVLLLGVFDWSNYSRSVFQQMASSEAWFVEEAIGVGVVCLENPIQLKTILPGAYEHYMKLNMEPAMFFIVDSEVRSARSGPLPFVEIAHWVLLQRELFCRTKSG
jgi:hypothetical protein